MRRLCRRRIPVVVVFCMPRSTTYARNYPGKSYRGIRVADSSAARRHVGQHFFPDRRPDTPRVLLIERRSRTVLNHAALVQLLQEQGWHVRQAELGPQC